jgi:tetratricopeptide (TPR) repeat protein
MAKRAVLYLCIITAIIAVSCPSQTRLEQEFDELKASEKRGEEYIQPILEFERKNPGHFRSKVELGAYYAAAGNPTLSKEFFLRAKEVVKNAPKTGEGERDVTKMYGTLAELAIYDKDFAKAEEYAEMAVAFDNEYAPVYKLVKPRILVLQDKYKEALELFDEAYRDQPETMILNDIKSYMYLLAEAGRNEECAGVIDYYFEKGPYYSGLGGFASVIYESSGQFSKSIYMAFLEFEFQASYRHTDTAEFVKKMDSLEQKMAQWKILDETQAAIQLLRSAYEPTIEYRRPENLSSFVEEYIIVKNKIRDGTVNTADFNRLLRLERYFSTFPVYYWNIWQAVGILDKSGEKNFAPVLGKIVTLDENNIYIQRARDELARVLGL